MIVGITQSPIRVLIVKKREGSLNRERKFSAPAYASSGDAESTLIAGKIMIMYYIASAHHAYSAIPALYPSHARVVWLGASDPANAKLTNIPRSSTRPVIARFAAT
jgi:hypothetical protein